MAGTIAESASNAARYFQSVLLRRPVMRDGEEAFVPEPSLDRVGNRLLHLSLLLFRLAKSWPDEKGRDQLYALVAEVAALHLQREIFRTKGTLPEVVGEYRKEPR
jgi:hypothetical protein